MHDVFPEARYRALFARLCAVVSSQTSRAMQDHAPKSMQRVVHPL